VVDASELGAIHEDVPFDWSGATRLKAALEALASAIDAQRGPRMEAFAAGLKSWQGAAKAAYDQSPRHVQGDTDAGELTPALRDAIADIEAMERAAREENDRRRRARDWVQAYKDHEENETFLDDVGDFFTGEDFQPPPMPEPPHPEPNLVPPPGPAADPRA
jgi:hypothetical protein